MKVAQGLRYFPGIVLGLVVIFAYWELIDIFGVWELIPWPIYGETPYLPISFYKSLHVSYTIVLGPLMEELVYRWPLVWLAKRKFSRKAVVIISAVMVSSLIFGITHTLHFGEVIMPPSGWIWFGIVMSGPGLIFSIIAIYYKSVAASFVAHAAYNAIFLIY